MSDKPLLSPDYTTWLHTLKNRIQSARISAARAAKIAHVWPESVEDVECKKRKLNPNTQHPERCICTALASNIQDIALLPLSLTVLRAPSLPCSMQPAEALSISVKR